MKLHRAALALAAGWLAAAAQPALATDLLDAWRAAQQADLEYSAARSAREAGAARREQGASLWRPSVQFSGTLGVGNSETSTSGAQFSAPGFGTTSGVDFNTSVNGGTATRWALQARQPLVNRERDANKRQLELAADMAEIEWEGAQQALMLRTAERYFDVVLAAQTLRVLRRQQDALARESVEAQDRFRLGDAPVTDTHEAQSRLEASRAQVLAAQTQLELAQTAFADATGLANAELRAPGANAEADAGLASLPALAQWLADTKTRNPQLRVQLAAAEVAQREAAKFDALAAPTLDLVAEVGQDRINGSGDYGDASNRQNNALIGVQLVVPLYSGGWRGAKQTETQRLAEKATTDAERARQQVALQTRAAWLGLTAGSSRIKALADALKASRSRLDATRVGREAGERTTLDLLNAENDAAAAELALLQARVKLLLDRLRLDALAGRLDEAALAAVNSTLAAQDAPR
ncbi:MAG TPA: TolC family protein [Burkholderiaceae bacterium]|nr:TolC family protein [Burkholderiaceae bacterium]